MSSQTEKRWLIRFLFPSNDNIARTATHGPLGGPIAQSAEHRADNAGVSGAIPLRPTILKHLFFEELIGIAEPLDQHPSLCYGGAPYIGAVAQLGERLLCKQEVRGSIPRCSTICGFS